MGLPAVNPAYHAIEIDFGLSAETLPRMRFLPRVEHSFEAFLALVLVLKVFLLFDNAVLDRLFNNSLVWADEVAEYELSSLAFIGGTIAHHFSLPTQQGADFRGEQGLVQLFRRRLYAICGINSSLSVPTMRQRTYPRPEDRS